MTNNPLPSLSSRLTEAMEVDLSDFEFDSPIEWLRLLKRAAILAPDWTGKKSLVELARRLASRQSWPDQADENEYAEYAADVDRLLANLRREAEEPMMCGAIREDGQRCFSRARDGITCGLRAHRRQGAALLCRDTAGDTGHPTSSFICFGCGRPSDEHEEHEYVSCMTCPSNCYTSCLPPVNEGETLTADKEPICSWCIDQGRDPMGLVLSTARDEDDSPTMPDIFAALAREPAREVVDQHADHRRRSARNQSARASTAYEEEDVRSPEPTRAAEEPVHHATGRGQAAGCEGNRRPSSFPTAYDPNAMRMLQDQVETLAATVARLADDIRARPAAEVSYRPVNHSGGHSRGADPIRGEIENRHDPYRLENAGGFPWPGCTPVSVSEFVGAKAGTDVAGRPGSSTHHYLHPNYGRHYDYLCGSTEEAARKFREHLGFRESTPKGSIPERHYLEDFWRNSIDYHWRMLHMVGDNFSPDTETGRERINHVLLILSRLRWFSALTSACDRVPGGSTWPETYDILTTIHKAEIEGTDYTPFDQFSNAIIAQQREQLTAGIRPHLTDGMQQQLIHAARGRLATYYGNYGTPQGPANRSKPTGPMKCALCGASDHLAASHPEGAPITIACRRCGQYHRRTGPGSTPCDTSK